MIYLGLIASLIAVATAQFASNCVADSTVCIENEVCDGTKDECDYAPCSTLDDCTANYPAMNAVKCESDYGACFQSCTVTANFCTDWYFTTPAQICDTETGLCVDPPPPNCLDNPSEVPCYTEQICNSTSKTCDWILCDNGACTEPTRPICDVVDHCAQNCSTQISTFCTDRYYGSFANKATCFPDSGKCLKATCLNSISEACAANEICNSADIDLVFCEKIACANGACSNPSLPICDKDDYCAPNCTISSTFCDDIYTETICFTTLGKCLTPNCVNSPITEACEYDQYCDTKTEQCKYNFCSVNADCTESSLPVCNGNNCEPYCDTLASDYCESEAASEYGVGFVCDGTLKECVKYCTTTEDCGDTDYVCDISICQDLTTCTDDTECKKLFGIFKNFANPVPWPLATCDDANRECSEECATGGCEGISDYNTIITGTEDKWEYTCNTDTVPETCEKRSCQDATVCKNDFECNGGYCWEQTDAPTNNPSMPSYAPSTPSATPVQVVVTGEDGEDEGPGDGGKAVRYNVFGIYVVVFVMVLSMEMCRNY